MKLLQIKNIAYKIFLETLVFDKKKRAVLKSRWTKKHLKKYVEFAVKNTKIPEDIEAGSSKIIWQYWHQGKENAPELMQRCFESITKFHPECDIRILSFDTIKDYVEIPQKYYDLLEKKKIPIAIFSDILRLYLLTKYGGTWIDSTIYLTNRIPQEIFDSEFFVLQKKPENDRYEDKMSCFFIRANANNIWPHLIKNTLEAYWAENDFLINYFMFEHASSMLACATPELEKDWNKMPFYIMYTTAALQARLFIEFDENLANELKKKTSIHKLSYKRLKNETSGNTFYDRIVAKKF